MNCQPLLQRRQACYDKHGLPPDRLLLEKSQSSHAFQSSHPCLVSTLHAKRCLAFAHCEREALQYYGTPNDTLGPKSLCASFEEAHCFGNPGRMKVDNGNASAEKERMFLHHQNAKRRIVNNRDKFRACQEISERIHQCLRTVKIVDSLATP